MDEFDWLQIFLISWWRDNPWLGWQPTTILLLLILEWRIMRFHHFPKSISSGVELSGESFTVKICVSVCVYVYFSSLIFKKIIFLTNLCFGLKMTPFLYCVFFSEIYFQFQFFICPVFVHFLLWVAITVVHSIYSFSRKSTSMWWTFVNIFQISFLIKKFLIWFLLW